MVGRSDLRGMTDAWQAYIDLALGFTETSRKRATKVVRQVVGKGNATADQLQTMAEELVNTGLANREAMVRLVRFELDRALGRVGLATAEEVAELTGRVRDLEQQLTAAQTSLAEVAPQSPLAASPGAELGAEEAVPPRPAAGSPVANPPVAKKAVKVAKKAVKQAAPVAGPAEAVASTDAPAKPAKKAAASKATASKATASKATASKATASRSDAESAPAKKAGAKKAAAKAPATTATGAGTGAGR
jgi:polyhydroxyalkanoate synthesis regulator phasin